MKVAIIITGYESNYEGDIKRWVDTPTRLQITEDFEYPGMEGRYFELQYKPVGKSRYKTRRSVHIFNNNIKVNRFQDVFGNLTEIFSTNPNINLRIGIQPERNGHYTVFMAEGSYSIKSFEISKSQFTKTEKYLRSIKDVVA